MSSEGFLFTVIDFVTCVNVTKVCKLVAVVDLVSH